MDILRPTIQLDTEREALTVAESDLAPAVRDYWNLAAADGIVDKVLYRTASEGSLVAPLEKLVPFALTGKRDIDAKVVEGKRVFEEQVASFVVEAFPVDLPPINALQLCHQIPAFTLQAVDGHRRPEACGRFGC